VFERHPLAAERLCEIVRREGRFQAFPQSDIPSLHRGSGACPLAVVVDLETLPIPRPTWLRSFRSQVAEAKMIALGHALDDEETGQLLFSGVQGFVAHKDVEKDLSRAIESVCEGRLWVNRKVLERVVQEGRALSRSHKEQGKLFTAREKEILRLLPRRLCNKEIASAVGIRERTVKFHLASIFRKLGVHDRYSAIDLVKQTEPSRKVT
jgi:DNA-binding NarL/FixJ family response regulator